MFLLTASLKASCPRAAAPVFSSSASASTSALLPLLIRSVHYDATGRRADLSLPSMENSPTTLWLSKLPNFYGAEQIRERFASIGCAVKDIHVPPSFNEAGKRRKNSRGFAYVEFETKDAMRKAFTSVEKSDSWVVRRSKWGVEEARTHKDWAFDPEFKKKQAARAREEERLANRLLGNGGAHQGPSRGTRPREKWNL